SSPAVSSFSVMRTPVLRTVMLASQWKRRSENQLMPGCASVEAPANLVFDSCTSPSAMSLHPIANGLVAEVVRLSVRTRRERHDQIHLGAKAGRVSRLAPRRQHPYLTGLRVDVDMHEDIERDRYAIRRDAIRRHGPLQISLAAMVWLVVLVDDAEHFL